jgi:hypothetical protein
LTFGHETGAFWELGGVSDEQLRSGSRRCWPAATAPKRESEAFHRLTAARIAQRFPAVFGMVERREIHLSAVCLLRDYLTPEDHLELLAEASHKTKFQVQEPLARRFPRPDVVSRVRKLPNAKQASTPTPRLSPLPRLRSRSRPPWPLRALSPVVRQTRRPFEHPSNRLQRPATEFS